MTTINAGVLRPNARFGTQGFGGRTRVLGVPHMTTKNAGGFGAERAFWDAGVLGPNARFGGAAAHAPRESSWSAAA